MNQKMKNRTSRLVLNALFAALFVLFATVPPFTWKFSFIEFSFLVTLPILASAVFFSWQDALAVALVGSFLEQLFSPYGLASNTPLWMLPIVLQALFFGLVFSFLPKPHLSRFAVPLILAGELLLTAGNTGVAYLDAFLFHYNIEAFTFLLALEKTANCAIRTTVTIVVFYTLFPKLQKMIDSRNSV